MQSSVTEPTYLPLHHSSIGTEPSTCPLLIILFKSSLTGCSTTMTGSWVNTSYLRSSDHSTEKLLTTTNKIYNTYSNDLSHRVAFDNEIVRWKARWALAEGDKPNNLEDTLSCKSKDLYPSVATVLTILFTMPVSTATPERSFSTMRSAVHYADRATIISSSYARIQGDAD